MSYYIWAHLGTDHTGETNKEKSQEHNYQDWGTFIIKKLYTILWRMRNSLMRAPRRAAGRDVYDVRTADRRVR